MNELSCLVLRECLPLSLAFMSDQTFSIGLQSGGCGGQAICSMPFSFSHVLHRRILCFGSFSSNSSQFELSLPWNFLAVGNSVDLYGSHILLAFSISFFFSLLIPANVQCATCHFVRHFLCSYNDFLAQITIKMNPDRTRYGTRHHSLS